MGTVSVRVVFVGGGRSMPSFYFVFLFFLYTFMAFLSRYWPCRRHLTLYRQGMESGLSPFLRLIFVAILAFFHLVGVMCSLFVGNGICPFSYVTTYSALHIHHQPCFRGPVDYKCTSDYPIHSDAACPTQKAFSASCIKCQ